MTWCPSPWENSGLHRPMYMCWPKKGKMRPVVRNFRDYIINRVGNLPS